MNYLIHYGMPRRSGRYPWGSGNRPYQDDLVISKTSNKTSNKTISNKRKSKSKLTDNGENSNQTVTNEETSKPKLTDKQKRILKTGAVVAAAMLVSYGGYKISSSPKIRGLIYKGMSALEKSDQSILDEPITEIVNKKTGEVLRGEAAEAFMRAKGLL